MDKMNAHIDLGGQYINFSIERKSLLVELQPDFTINKARDDESEDKLFITDCSTTSSAEVDE